MKGHDEYLYMVMKDYLPPEALYVIRYHSFYAAHKENEYRYLMNETDHKMMEHVKKFNQYDLYSKDKPPVIVDDVKAFYQGTYSSVTLQEKH
jgi:inositol oxygenase